MMTTVNASSDRHDVQRSEPTFQDKVLNHSLEYFNL